MSPLRGSVESTAAWCRRRSCTPARARWPWCACTRAIPSCHWRFAAALTHTRHLAGQACRITAVVVGVAYGLTKSTYLHTFRVRFRWTGTRGRGATRSGGRRPRPGRQPTLCLGPACLRPRWAACASGHSADRLTALVASQRSRRPSRRTGTTEPRCGGPKDSQLPRTACRTQSVPHAVIGSSMSRRRWGALCVVMCEPRHFPRPTRRRRARVVCRSHRIRSVRVCQNAFATRSCISGPRN